VLLTKTYYNTATEYHTSMSTTKSTESTTKKSTNPALIIKGLAGKKTLKGRVSINGAKNAALKAMAAAVLFNKKVRLENVPHTADIDTLTTILEKLGAKVSWVGARSHDGEVKRNHIMEIDTSTINSTDIDPKLAAGMRASIVLTGPLLARFGKVTFPAPGGCVIGARPIDLFIEGYKKIGAKVTLKDGLYHISAPNGLSGMDNFFHIISVGGTETLMMAAVLAKGKTILSNCAKEPEIANVAEWLVSCGAKIKGAGTSTIEIVGNGRNLHPTDNFSNHDKLLDPIEHFVTIPDRIETGSFLLLGALCANDLSIDDCEPKHIESLLHLLDDSGVSVTIKKARKIDGKSSIIIKDVEDPQKIYKAFDIRTKEYPGFPTDLQAPVVAFLTQATGESHIMETIFEGRFKYVEDLCMLGANITVLNPHEIKVIGPTPLIQQTELYAHDIRAGFAIVMAALVAKGQFIVHNAHLIDRGYEDIEKRLCALGADVKRML